MKIKKYKNLFEINKKTGLFIIICYIDKLLFITFFEINKNNLFVYFR